MYADDILIYLSNPEQSIAALMKTKKFWDISEYALNISDEVKHKWPFHWDVDNKIPWNTFNKELKQFIFKKLWRINKPN